MLLCFICISCTLLAHKLSSSSPFIFPTFITQILHLFLTENNLLLCRYLPWLSFLTWIFNRIGWKRPEINSLLLEKKEKKRQKKMVLSEFLFQGYHLSCFAGEGCCFFYLAALMRKADGTITHRLLWLLCYSKTFTLEGCECDESPVSFGLILLAGFLGQMFQCVGLGWSCWLLQRIGNKGQMQALRTLLEAQGCIAWSFHRK